MLMVIVGLWAWVILRSKNLVPRAMIATIAAFIAYGTGLVLKEFFHEPRPCAVLPGETVSGCVTMDVWSFPSNHSVFASAWMVACILIVPRLWSLFWTMSILLAASRVFVGVHYVHDVLAGLSIGAAVTLSIYLIVTRLAAKAADKDSLAP